MSPTTTPRPSPPPKLGGQPRPVSTGDLTAPRRRSGRTPGWRNRRQRGVTVGRGLVPAPRDAVRVPSSGHPPETATGVRSSSRRAPVGTLRASRSRARSGFAGPGKREPHAPLSRFANASVALAACVGGISVAGRAGAPALCRRGIPAHPPTPESNQGPALQSRFARSSAGTARSDASKGREGQARAGKCKSGPKTHARAGQRERGPGNARRRSGSRAVSARRGHCRRPRRFRRALPASASVEWERLGGPGPGRHAAMSDSAGRGRGAASLFARGWDWKGGGQRDGGKSCPAPAGARRASEPPGHRRRAQVVE